VPEPRRWKPFSDLPEDWSALTDSELESLHKVWLDQRQALQQSGLEEFHQRLGREWAIETGIIEGVYQLDRGVTRTLIEQGIQAALIPHDSTDRAPEEVACILHDHTSALEGMFAFVRGERSLTVGYINELHAALLRHQDVHTVVDSEGRLFPKTLEKGAYKTSPNNPTRQNGSIHEYCPPVQVGSEMDRMVDLHQTHVRQDVPPEVEAAWLHHVFTEIHPYADGNGRVARAIASLVFLKRDWFPLVITRDDRSRYIVALETADDGDLRPLVSLFVESQRRSLIQANEIVWDVKPPRTIEEEIQAARDLLVSRGDIGVKDWLNAKDNANQLVVAAAQRLDAISNSLQKEIGSVSHGFAFQTGSGQLSEIGDELGYSVSLTDYNRCVRLHLVTGRKFQVIVSLHSVGPKFRGLIGAAVFLESDLERVLVPGGMFQTHYRESGGDALGRFLPWLDEALRNALSRWRRTL